MTNIRRESSAIGTIIHKSELYLNKNSRRLWLPLDSGGIGKANCRWNGQSYRNLYEVINQRNYSGSKNWDTDIIQLPITSSTLYTNGTVGNTTGTGWWSSGHTGIYICPSVASVSGFIQSITTEIYSASPTTRDVFVLQRGEAYFFTAISITNISYTASPIYPTKAIYVPKGAYIGLSVITNLYGSPTTNGFASTITPLQGETMSILPGAFPSILATLIPTEQHEYYIAYA